MFYRFLFLCILGFPLWASPIQNEESLKINLDTAIRIGTSNYFGLQALKNKNEAIRSLITERWRNYLPSAGIGLIRQKYIISDSQDAISNEVRFNVEQVIYDGGRRGLDLDIAKLEELLSREDFKMTFNRVRLEIQKVFLNALSARGKIKLNERSLQRAKTQLRHSENELKQGFTTGVQVKTVGSRVKEIEISLLKSKNEGLRALNDLKQILQLEYNTELELEGNLFQDFILKKPEIDTRNLIGTARSERSEILRSRINLFKIEKELELAENAWIPRISVGGYVGKMSENFPLREDTWGVNLKITLPLGNSTNNTNTSTGVRPNSLAGTGIRNDNLNYNNSTQSNLQFYDNLTYTRNVMEAKIRLGEGIAEKNRLEQAVAIEVLRAIDNLNESWETIRLGTMQTRLRLEALRLMTTKYTTGDTRRVDVLFSEIEMVESQDRLVSSLTKYIVSACELEWIAGLESGHLELYSYQPGKGNIRLDDLLNDFEKQKKKEEKPKTESILDQIQDDFRFYPEGINFNEKEENK